MNVKHEHSILDVLVALCSIVASLAVICVSAVQVIALL